MRHEREVSIGALAFLQDPLEFAALIVVENLFDTRFPVAQHGSIVVPEIGQNGAHLFGLRGRQIQFAVHAIEERGLALGRIEGGRTGAVVDPEVHHQGAYRRAAQKNQRQRHAAGEPGVPKPLRCSSFQNANAHRMSALPACYRTRKRCRSRARPVEPECCRARGRRRNRPPA